ncbi:ABC transporter ATP-binding protein [Actinomadura viridis]|uniref:Multiple sugar transport system ATP-binding protein n=1 Tax=Actinomadura viridis TaxID=58110 RepID=A0A931DN46_9ACTN|nr:ABC transporter ATP-binding protein [Actinomadura viridis]MBG6090661.1 multiple sugar transport system ATP-binding protein [Actinomadura viridis]
MADLALRALRKTYSRKGRPDVEAVRGIDLEIPSGEMLGLLGPSGCGKSTTLRMIAGLEEVTGGDIVVAGSSVAGLPPQRRNIGVAFENYALYPPLTVAENLAFGLAARRRGDRREIAARVRAMAERIEITELLDAKPGGLSSGQKQRIALARALVREPDVLLLDEPLSHLDAAQRDTTRRELKRLQSDLGYTTILVTHDQEEALSLADRIAVMKDGEIQQIGTPDEIYDAPATLFVADFVGEPAINLLPGTVTAAAGDGDGPGGDGRGGLRLSESVRVPLPAGIDLEPGRAVVLGVRPEDVAPSGEADADLRGTVVVYEPLLEMGLATVRLEGVDRPLLVQTDPAVRLERDQTVHLRLDPRRSHLFDAETQKAITRTERR